LTDDPRLNLSSGIANGIYNYDRGINDKAVVSAKADFYLPVWQVSSRSSDSVISTVFSIISLALDSTSIKENDD